MVPRIKFTIKFNYTKIEKKTTEKEAFVFIVNHILILIQEDHFGQYFAGKFTTYYPLLKLRS